MPGDYLTYREMRKIIPKQDMYDMVAFNILTPIEKTNTTQSWRFRVSDITDDLFKRLNYVRDLRYQSNVNEILANKIEHEWKPRTKNKATGSLCDCEE